MAYLGRQFNLVKYLTVPVKWNLGKKHEDCEGNLIINDSIYNIIWFSSVF